MPVLAVSEDPTVEENCVRSFSFVEESTDPDGFSVHPAKNNPNPTKPKMKRPPKVRPKNLTFWGRYLYGKISF